MTGMKGMDGRTTGARPATAFERRQEMAQAGDVAGLLELLHTMRSDADRANDVLKDLGTAIGVRSRQDPEGYSRDVFAQMVAMTSHLLFRAHHFANLRIQAYSRAPWGKGRPDLPADIEAALARLRDLQGHVGELLQGQASVARLWELTRAKRLEHEELKDPSVTPNRDRKKGRPKEGRNSPSTLGNGHPANRISGLLDGMAMGTDGVGHDE